MSEIKKQVEFLLKSYTAMQNEVKVLEYELRHMTYNLRSEAIEGAVLSHSGFERVSGSYHSDKTSDIVVEHVARQQNARYHTIAALLHNIRSELQRMDYYLTLLPDNEAMVLRRFYFDNMTWEEIMESASFAYSTMRLWKKNGVAKLVRYYSILQNSEIQSRIRFIDCEHEERFMSCAKPSGECSSRGVEAMKYVLCGSEELWQLGMERFIDSETGIPINRDETPSILSGDGKKLLRLAYRLADGIDKNDPALIFRDCFTGMEYGNIELAIEGIRMAYFPDSI